MSQIPFSRYLQYVYSLQQQIDNVNSTIKNAENQISKILNNINELIGIDIDELIHKSDLNSILNPILESYLTKNDVLSTPSSENKIITQSEITEFVTQTEAENYLTKNDVLSTPSSENKIITQSEITDFVT
jgi:uncharacterized HAD superfamily protein